MKTIIFCLALCFISCSIHSKILVLNEMSDLRRLSLPSCEKNAEMKFSDIQKDLNVHGVTNSNGAGRALVNGKFEYLTGVLCHGANGSKIPGWVDLNGKGFFSELGTYKECGKYEVYEWKYMISLDHWADCNCNAKGVDYQGQGLYPVVYVDYSTKEFTPGYMKKSRSGAYYINKGNEVYAKDNFYMMC